MNSFSVDNLDRKNLRWVKLTIYRTFFHVKKYSFNIEYRGLALISTQRKMCLKFEFFLKIKVGFDVLLQTTVALLIIWDILGVKY